MKEENITMEEVCHHIRQIPLEIKHYVLRQYMCQIQKLTTIQFYKERLKSNSPFLKTTEVESNMAALRKHLMSVYNQSKNIDHLTVRTRRKAAIDTENLRKYGMI